MKHNKVLHRPMFDAQNSAYGRGITSNLVTEEQRVKYNTGGRVRLQDGSNWKFSETGLGKTLGGVGDALWYQIPGALADPFNLASNKLVEWTTGYNPGLSARKGIRRQKDELFGIDRANRMTDEDVNKNILLGMEFDATEGWRTPSMMEKVAEEEEEEKNIKTVKKPTEVDPKSDTLDWTDQEKKEKMGQILLKGGQRLVSGSRDKWGSKEQMKNLGDWMGDVAAIGDKTELRKDERKYKAMGKAYKEISRDKLASAKEYGNQIAGGATESQALKVSTNGKLRSIQLPRNKKQRDKMVETLVVGDIYFDEGASTNKFFIAGHEDKDGKGIPVPKDQLAEVQALVIQRGA